MNDSGQGISGVGAVARAMARPLSAHPLILVSIGVLLLGAMSVFATWSLRVERMGADWVIHTEQVRDQLSRILQLSLDAHAGAREYALTGEDALLQSYRTAEASLFAEIRRLAELVSDNPKQRALAAHVEAFAGQLGAIDESILRSAGEDNPARARAIVGGGPGQQQMSELRSVLAQMRAEEDRLLQARRLADRHARHTALFALGGTGALGALLLIFVVLVFRDVTEERGRERTLQLRDSEMQIVNDHARIPIARCDTQHRYLFVNRVYAERLGTTPQACVGKHIRDIAGAPAYEAVRPQIEQTLRGSVVEFEASIPYPGGARFMRCVYAPDRDERGQVRSFVAAVTDITDRKSAEDALRASEARFRAVQETSIDGFMILESVRDETGLIVDFKWIYANEASERLLGRPRSWFIGRSYLVVRPGHGDGLFNRFRDLVENGEPWSGESIFRHEGTERYFRIVATKTGDGFAATFADMSESRRAEVQLRQTEAALREADTRKDVFLATLAHELRNPLAPIRAAARILSSPQVVPQQFEWAQSVIDRQVRHMTLLLDDLLDIARVTQGKLKLKKERIALAGSVEAAVEAARPLLDDKGHHLTVRLPKEPIMLDADPLRLSQILSNLLTNAAKYTDPGGQVELTAMARESLLHLSVKDNGIGISAESLTHIFEMFSQVEGASARSDGGLGIGLALVKGLIELHDGHVDVRSEGLGRGSEFTIAMPLSTPAADRRG